MTVLVDRSNQTKQGQYWEDMSLHYRKSIDPVTAGKQKAAKSRIADGSTTICRYGNALQEKKIMIEGLLGRFRVFHA